MTRHVNKMAKLNKQQRIFLEQELDELKKKNSERKISSIFGFILLYFTITGKITIHFSYLWTMFAWGGAIGLIIFGFIEKDRNKIKEIEYRLLNYKRLTPKAGIFWTKAPKKK